MGKPGNTGFTRLIKAFRHEAAFRQELGFCVVLTPLAFWLGKTNVEVAVMVGCLLIVLMVELLNSAVEAVVDRFGGERHELSARAKDMGSAAVFVSLANVIIVWSIIVFF